MFLNNEDLLKSFKNLLLNTETVNKEILLAIEKIKRTDKASFEDYYPIVQTLFDLNSIISFSIFNIIIIIIFLKNYNMILIVKYWLMKKNIRRYMKI